MLYYGLALDKGIDSNILNIFKIYHDNSMHSKSIMA